MQLDAAVRNRLFRFSRSDGTFLGLLTLHPNGFIGGTQSSNEMVWTVDGEEHLTFRDGSGQATTVFRSQNTASDSALRLVGSFLPEGKSDWHQLERLELTPGMLSELGEFVFGRRGDGYDVMRCAELAAAFDSANYYSEHMLAAKPFSDKFSLLADAMASRPAEGLVLEFGVFSGVTLNHVASLTDQDVYGFDVFTGLPQPWRPGYPKGTFAVENLPAVRHNVELVVGLFEDTLIPFLDRTAGDASLIHVDCDLYSATRTIFLALASRIVVGTVIVFDEFFNYQGWREHEYKAFNEFLAESGRQYKFLSFVRNHQQVAVQITG